MLNQQALSRRVDVSATISDYVYRYEKKYTEALHDGDNNTVPADIAEDSIIDELTKDGLTLSHAQYDPATGIAAIAVYDSQTGETYIAYAGTNRDADGMTDIVSDVKIGINDALALKKLGNAAINFYDQVQSTGANITATTGHSYADFLSTYVAISRNVPYKFGYQGAPQYVAKLTPQEIALNNLYAQGITPPQEAIQAAKTAREEANRMQRLMNSYSGYAVTFSTSGDFLTNSLWNQKKGEFDFGGNGYSAIGRAGTSVLSLLWGSSIDTRYVGHVIAVDANTPHSMFKYRTNPYLMDYTLQIVLAQFTAVDFDGDGVSDFLLDATYLTKQPLIPLSKVSGDGTKIELDAEAMTVLESNLTVIKGQLDEFYQVVQTATEQNEEILASLASRRQTLKDAIVTELEAISLVEAIRKIDTAYSNLENLQSVLPTLADYETFEFSRQFDGSGVSGNYRWFSDSGGKTPWHFYPTSNTLNNLSWAAQILNNHIRDYLKGISNSSPSFFNLHTQTDVAAQGVAVINSFENIIEQTTAGLGNRARFEDGIPQAIQEVLLVLAQNLTNLISGVQYLINVTGIIRETLLTTDATLATDIQTLNLSSLPISDISISKDYNQFLEETGVFDDKKVIQAFDDQVDEQAENLANQMATAFEGYLSEVKGQIETFNTDITNLTDELISLTPLMATNLYYKKTGLVALTTLDKENPLIPAGTVGSHIAISSTINSLANGTHHSSLLSSDITLTEAITTINTAYSSLGGFKEPFRIGMEDAFYGVAGLKNVAKSQKLVGLALESLETRFSEFQTQLSNQSGKAIEALTNDLTDLIRSMSHVSQMIADCFGD